MNEAHVHLLINHFPVIGVFMGAIWLTFARFTSRDSAIPHSLWLLLISGVLVLPAYQSGEAAEEFWEGNQREEGTYVEDHEEAAEMALVVGLLTGIGAALSLWTRKKGLKQSGMALGATLVLSWVGVAALSLTANSGGMISHQELRYEAGVKEETSHSEMSKEMENDWE